MHSDEKEKECSVFLTTEQFFDTNPLWPRRKLIQLRTKFCATGLKADTDSNNISFLDVQRREHATCLPSMVVLLFSLALKISYCISRKVKRCEMMSQDVSTMTWSKSTEAHIP
jgi:hypothetical protein